jgi:enoyl-CoA hydratase/carnithine racemase
LLSNFKKEPTLNDAKKINLEIDGHIAWLNLCRPERRNAMDMAFFNELTEHFRHIDKDPAVRAAVIRAEGRSFTAGLDLKEAGTILIGNGAGDRERLRQKILELQESNNAIERCRKPVIAAVHGHCLGAGVDLLSACDVRLASADARFSIRETRIAMIADLGTLQRLPHIIGQGWFRELALTGRDFTADEALQMGFVTRVCENREALFEAADGLAKQIAGLAPLTVQGVKEVVNYSRDNGVYAGLTYVAQKNAAAIPSEDLMEGVAAFMEKRDPLFHGK